jgi:hypothetical protein
VPGVRDRVRMIVWPVALGQAAATEKISTKKDLFLFIIIIIIILDLVDQRHNSRSTAHAQCPDNRGSWEKVLKG